jgi:excisionase family DNA binding protein
MLKDTQRLLSVASTAARLDLSELTVRRMIDAGSIRAVKLGRRTLRIQESEVERLIAHGTRKARR